MRSPPPISATPLPASPRISPELVTVVFAASASGGQIIALFVFAEEIGCRHAIGGAGDLTAVGHDRAWLSDHDPAAGPIVDAA